MLDAAGHAAYALIALGMVLLARRHWLGWVCRFLGEAGWLWIGWRLGMSSIWTWGAAFLLMDAYGLWLWLSPSDSVDRSTPRPRS